MCQKNLNVQGYSTSMREKSMGRNSITCRFPVSGLQDAGDFRRTSAAHAPTSRRVPTRIRTMLYKSRLPEGKPQLRSHSGYIQAVDGADCGFFIFLLEQKERKSCCPTKWAAAASIASSSEGPADGTSIFAEKHRAPGCSRPGIHRVLAVAFSQA